MFGAEFAAIKTRVETLRDIRYKLRMMDVDIKGPTYIYEDNQCVINNDEVGFSTNESQLHKCYFLACDQLMKPSQLMKLLQSSDDVSLVENIFH